MQRDMRKQDLSLKAWKYISKKYGIVRIDLSTLFGERNLVLNGIQLSCVKIRSNLRINPIVWERRRTGKKVVGILLETEKIEILFS